MSAREIERKYDLTPKSAWFLLHRIREGMSSTEPPFWTDTEVVADETFIGPNLGRMNNKRRKAHEAEHGGKTTRGTAHKTPVVTLINRETGESYSRVLNDVSAVNVRQIIEEVADLPNLSLIHISEPTRPY